jgi:hypothetical protein
MKKLKLKVLVFGIILLSGLLIGIAIDITKNTLSTTDEIRMKNVVYHEDNSITFKNNNDDINFFTSNTATVTFTPAEVSELKSIFEKADKVADICKKSMNSNFKVTLGKINDKTILYNYNTEYHSFTSTIVIDYIDEERSLNNNYLPFSLYNPYKKSLTAEEKSRILKIYPDFFHEQVLVFRNKKFADYFGKYKNVYVKQHAKKLKVIKKIEEIVKPPADTTIISN